MAWDKYYFLNKNIPHGMPEIGVEQGDGFCHIELFLSQHHSQKEDIAHTEGTQTLMKGNLNISKSVILCTAHKFFMIHAT